MAAGFKYDLKPTQTLDELCRYETVYRLSGGFNLDVDNLNMVSHLPILAPLKVDFKTRKAVAIRNVRVLEKLSAEMTEFKVAKGSLCYIGMNLGNGSKVGVITKIDHKPEFDLLTIKEAGLTANAGDVLFESNADGKTPKVVANFLNYGRRKIELGATVTVIGKAYEVIESKLPIPLSTKDKEGLTSRFMFV